MGTGVKYVAEQVAQRLGLSLVYREICETARSSEAFAPRFHGQAPRWEIGLASLHSQRQSSALADVEDLYRLVQRDNVLICGNTPLHFLSDIAHVVKVRVRTTMALRVRRIMACMNTDESESALTKILQSDQRQAEALNRLFGIKDSEKTELYDLVVDTGREPAEDCALRIVALTSTNAGQSATQLGTLLEQVRTLRMGLLQADAGSVAEITAPRRPGADTKRCGQLGALVTRLQ
jgi:cytidylate kinase